MKHLLLALALCLPTICAATSVVPKPLSDRIREADHVVVATVARVEMVDHRGLPVRDREARTGPGLKNQLRFHLAVDEVLFSRGVAVPSTVVVPPWSAWYDALGTLQDQVTGSKGIFLLKGADFEPVHPAGFQRGLHERAEVVRLLEMRRDAAPPT